MEFHRERGLTGTIVFSIVKAGSTDLAVTGDWTPATGDVKRSDAGGNVANATNLPSAVGGTGSVLWTWTYTAAEANTDNLTLQIVDSATKAVEDDVHSISFRLGAVLTADGGIIRGEVDTGTFTATTIALEGIRLAPNLTEEATADHFNGTLIKFVSGDVRGIITNITDYELANSKEKFTYDAIATAPVATDRYVIL